MPKSISDIFIQESIKTESKDFDKIRERLTDQILRLDHAADGLVTEAGEFKDALKKWKFYGKSLETGEGLDSINLIEEMGDICWYLAIACDTLSISLDEVMQINMKKLARRYYRENQIKGFTEEKAVERNLEDERRILEDRCCFEDRCCLHPQVINGVCFNCGKGQ